MFFPLLKVEKGRRSVEFRDDPLLQMRSCKNSNLLVFRSKKSRDGKSGRKWEKQRLKRNSSFFCREERWGKRWPMRDGKMDPTKDFFFCFISALVICHRLFIPMQRLIDDIHHGKPCHPWLFTTKSQITLYVPASVGPSVRTSVRHIDIQ